MNKPRELMDRQTGEVVYALVPVSQTPRGERFFMGFAEAFQYLAENPLPVPHRQVFDYLFGALDMNNYLHIKQADIAEKLKLDPAVVSRAMKRLVEIGFIDPGPRDGRTNTYRMNAQVAWRGKAGARRSALAEANRRWGTAKA